MQDEHRAGLIFILLSVSGYAMFPIFTRFLLGSGLEPLDLAVIRFGSAIPLFWLLVLSRRSVPNRPLDRRRMMLGGTMMAVAALTGFIGIGLMPAGVYVLLFYTHPSMVAIANAIRGERLGAQGWAAVGLTLLGVALTLPDLPSQLRQIEDIRGVAVAMINAGAVVVYLLVSSGEMRGYNDTLRASAWVTTGAFLALLALLPLRLIMSLGDVASEQVLLIPPPDLRTVGLLAGLVFVSTVLPIATLNAGVRRLGSTRAALISTFEPVLLLGLAYLFLGEVVTPLQLVGGGLIIAAVLLLETRVPVAVRVEAA